jgi:hypothetical protein
MSAALSPIAWRPGLLLNLLGLFCFEAAVAAIERAAPKPKSKAAAAAKQQVRVCVCVRARALRWSHAALWRGMVGVRAWLPGTHSIRRLAHTCQQLTNPRVS